MICCVLFVQLKARQIKCMSCTGDLHLTALAQLRIWAAVVSEVFRAADHNAPQALYTSSVSGDKEPPPAEPSLQKNG